MWWPFKKKTQAKAPVKPEKRSDYHEYGHRAGLSPRADDDWTTSPASQPLNSAVYDGRTYGSAYDGGSYSTPAGVSHHCHSSHNDAPSSYSSYSAPSPSSCDSGTTSYCDSPAPSCGGD